MYFHYVVCSVQMLSIWLFVKSQVSEMYLCVIIAWML